MISQRFYMFISKLNCLFLFASFISGCSLISNSFSSIDVSSVDAEKNSRIAQWNSFKQQAERKKEPLFKQAANKKQKCLIPQSREYMADSVTVYWDGDCLDGYAHGFGREIDVSDYMHQDVITVLDHSTVEDDSVGKIAWIRDYVSSTTSGKVFLNGEAKGYVTKVISSPSFDIVRTEGHFLKNGAFSGVRTSISHPDEKENLFFTPFFIYHYFENSDPTVNLSFLGVTTESSGNRTLGLLMEGTKSGQFYSSYNKQPVQTPPGYWNDFNEEIRKASNNANDAKVVANKIDEMLQKYLYKACKKDVNTDGIPKTLYSEICTFDSKYIPQIQAVVQQYREDQKQRQDQINVQRIIAAKEAEALAAQNAADAAQQAVVSANRIKNSTCVNYGYGIITCNTY